MKKLLSIIAPIALLSTLAMGGCAKGLGPADTDNVDVTVDTRGATISFWTGFGSSISDTLKEIVAEFSAKTGITVEYETKGGYPNLQTAINLSVTKKEFPNVAVGYPDHFAGYVNSNIQLRLDGLIKNDEKRKSDKKDENGHDADADGIRLLDYSNFYKDYTKENESLEFKADGTGYVLGLPFNKSSEGMAVNKTFFDWFATQEAYKDKIFVPTTWGEVKSVGLAVKDFFATKGIYGKILASNGTVYADEASIPEDQTKVYDATKVTSEDDFRLLSYDSTENLFITLVRQFGGTFTELDPTRTGKGFAAFNDADKKDKTLAAMDMYKDLADKKLVGIPATFGESLYCSTPFCNGRSLLNVGSTAGIYNAIPAGNAFKVKAAAIPQNENNPDGAKFVISQGTNLALFNKGTDKEKVAAWKLMVYLSQQANGRFAAETGYFPTCEDATNSKEYQDYLESSADAKGMITIECGRINKEVYGNKEDGWVRFVDPAFLGSSAVRQEAGYIPGYIISGEVGNNQQILDEVYKKLPDFTR